GVESDRDVVVGSGAVADEPAEARRERCRFTRAFEVSRCAESLERLAQQVESGPPEQEERACALEQEPRSLGIVGRAQCEGVREESRSRFGCGKRQGALACRSYRRARALEQDRIVRDAGRAGELQRLPVMVSKQLRVILGASEPFDPLSCPTVLL